MRTGRTLGFLIGLGLGIGAASAVGAVGDPWTGSATIAANGHGLYLDGPVVYTGRTLTLQLNDAPAATGYVVKATGEYIEAPDAWQNYGDFIMSPFVYEAKAVKLYDGTGTTVLCSKGHIAVGGKIRPYSPADPSYLVTTAAVHLTFPKSCSVLPGEQFMMTEDNPSSGFRYLRFTQR